MPDLNRFRRLGQQFTQGGQELIKQTVDQPIEDIRQRLIDANAAKEAEALRSLSGRPVDPLAVSPQAGALSNGDVSGVMNAMDAQIELNRRDKAMRQQMEMEEAARKMRELEDANAVYQPVDRERFRRLREGLK